MRHGHLTPDEEDWMHAAIDDGGRHRRRGFRGKPVSRGTREAVSTVEDCRWGPSGGLTPRRSTYRAGPLPAATEPIVCWMVMCEPPRSVGSSLTQWRSAIEAPIAHRKFLVAPLVAIDSPTRSVAVSAPSMSM
jgi:hypothetical protein